jgi:hypothetical protein
VADDFVTWTSTGPSTSSSASNLRHQHSRNCDRWSGEYVSEEIETTLTLALDKDRLVIRRTPDSIALTSVYKDAFSTRLGFNERLQADRGTGLEPVVRASKHPKRRVGVFPLEVRAVEQPRCFGRA